MKVAWLIDVLSAKPDIAAALVKACLQRAAKDDAHLFMMYQTRQSQSYQKSLGLVSGWPRTKPLAIRTEAMALPEAVRDFSKWYLNVVDTEDWI